MGEACRPEPIHYGLVTEHYDVIIVGSGAGGGTLAHTLAPSGKRILLLERGDFLPREMDNWKILNHVGMAQHHVLDKNFYMSMSIPIAGCAHQAGTCRFGNDPATSVLDVNCEAHELDNLYVVDTSIFPSIGAVNPALTAMANAIRVGEHLLSRMS
jgi:choline dehydrogenase-like flavoprotein